jgi:hypothetical protein
LPISAFSKKRVAADVSRRKWNYEETLAVSINISALCRLPGKAAANAGGARHSVRAGEVNQNSLVANARQAGDHRRAEQAGPPYLARCANLSVNCYNLARTDPAKRHGFKMKQVLLGSRS